MSNTVYAMVIPPGTPVEVKLPQETDHIDAVITEVLIRQGPSVVYKVNWFDDNQLQDEWVPDFMVQPKEIGKGKDYKPVGFIREWMKDTTGSPRPAT